jgi:preprotein translocase subunit Sec63
VELRHFHISDETTLDELKQQYRKLSMQHHPDKGGDKEVFQEINLEYRQALELIKQKAFQQNDLNLFKLINEQIYSIEGYINKLKVPEQFKPAISYLVEKGINELGKVIKQKLG